MFSSKLMMADSMSGYQLVVSVLPREDSTAVADYPLCSIMASIWDVEEWRNWRDDDESPPWDPLGLHGATPEVEITPLTLTIGRPFVRAIFDRAMSRGWICRVDPGGTMNDRMDWPVMCRTAGELDTCLDALAWDLGRATHTDVYPIQVWVMPADNAEETNGLVDEFWKDPDADEPFSAVMRAGVVNASVSWYSCDLLLDHTLRHIALGWVRSATRSWSLPVEWAK